jgi:SAM-dependent methyltransferase
MSGGYGAISCAYDSFNKDIDYAAWADLAEACFDAFLPSRPSLVLDLACGTGTLTEILASRGYDMTGVDISPEMLSVARERCPKGTLLLCQDISAFELYGTVGAVVCSLDSVNHLTKKSKLQKCFDLTHNYLDPNGIFIFDVNTPYRFENEYGKQSYQLEGELEDGRAVFCNWQNDYSKKRGICDFYLSLFTETAAGSNLYARADEEWSERCYSREELCSALSAAGFEILTVYGSTSMRSPRKTDSKLYFVARAKK